MKVPTAAVAAVKVAGEWIEVQCGSFKITSVEFTRGDGDTVYASLDTFYRFIICDDCVVFGPIEAIQAYRYHKHGGL